MTWGIYSLPRRGASPLLFVAEVFRCLIVNTTTLNRPRRRSVSISVSAAVALVTRCESPSLPGAAILAPGISFVLITPTHFHTGTVTTLTPPPPPPPPAVSASIPAAETTVSSMKLVYTDSTRTHADSSGGGISLSKPALLGAKESPGMLG